jgi:hypothetical protein
MKDNVSILLLVFVVVVVNFVVVCGTMLAATSTSGTYPRLSSVIARGEAVLSH